MSLKKSYSTDRRSCNVTFIFPDDAAPSAVKIFLAGDFNGWSKTENPMKKHKDGSWRITLSLDAGKEYSFRYFIDGSAWENDWNADKYVRSGFADAENSVVIV